MSYSYTLFYPYQWCLAEGGYLVEIGTQHEQEWIEMLMSSYILTGAYWLGLSDETQESVWKWQNSFVEASYTNWCYENPHTDRTSNCAQIMNIDEGGGNWFDVDCKLDTDQFTGWRIHAICETQNTPVFN